MTCDPTCYLCDETFPGPEKLYRYELGRRDGHVPLCFSCADDIAYEARNRDWGWDSMPMILGEAVDTHERWEHEREESA